MRSVVMAIDQKCARSSVSNCMRSSYRKWTANFAVKSQGRQGSVNDPTKPDWLLKLAEGWSRASRTFQPMLV